MFRSHKRTHIHAHTHTHSNTSSGLGTAPFFSPPSPAAFSSRSSTRALSFTMEGVPPLLLTSICTWNAPMAVAMLSRAAVITSFRLLLISTTATRKKQVLCVVRLWVGRRVRGWGSMLCIRVCVCVCVCECLCVRVFVWGRGVGQRYSVLFWSWLPRSWCLYLPLHLSCKIQVRVVHTGLPTPFQDRTCINRHLHTRHVGVKLLHIHFAPAAGINGGKASHLNLFCHAMWRSFKRFTPFANNVFCL